MDRGYIKTWRKIQDWEWYKDQNTYHLFNYLIMNASYKDSRFQGEEIKRGQVVFGRKQASADTGISEQSIRTSLTKLKSTSEITIKPTNRFSIITISNYDSYQSNEEKINQHINQQPNQQLTSNQPATNHIQEVKKVRSKEYNDSEFIPDLRKIYEPLGVSIDTELSKMRGWLLTKPNRKLTRQFAVRWLNKHIEQNKEIKTEQKPLKAFPINEYFK